MLTEETRDAPEQIGRRRIGLRHWVSREWYLVRVDLYLDGIVPGYERKRILQSLRDDLAAESSRHGVREALAGLGDPKALARSYVGGGLRPRPRWVVGIVAGGSALLLYWALFLSYTLGMLAVVEQFGTAEAHSQFLLVDVVAFSDDDAFGIGWSGGVTWLVVPVVIVAVVVVVAGRGWRVFGPRVNAGAASAV